MVGGNQVDNHATSWSNLQARKISSRAEIPKLDRVWQYVINVNNPDLKHVTNVNNPGLQHVINVNNHGLKHVYIVNNHG